MGIMNRNGFNETGMNGSFMDGMMMVEVMDGRIESMMMDGNMGSFSKYGKNHIKTPHYLTFL